MMGNIEEGGPAGGPGAGGAGLIEMLRSREQTGVGEDGLTCERDGDGDEFNP